MDRSIRLDNDQEAKIWSGHHGLGTSLRTDLKHRSTEVRAAAEEGGINRPRCIWSGQKSVRVLRRSSVNDSAPMGSTGCVHPRGPGPEAEGNLGKGSIVNRTM